MSRVSFLSETSIQVYDLDYELTFHSRSSVRSGVKNKINAIWNELQLNPDPCVNQHSSIPNEFGFM